MKNMSENKVKVNIKIPALIETQDFRPTQLMMKFMVAWLSPGTLEMSPGQILEMLGHTKASWYQ
jgi:hypothetical protein